MYGVGIPADSGIPTPMAGRSPPGVGVAFLRNRPASRLVRVCCVYPLNAHGPLSMMQKIAEGADRIVFVHPEEDGEEEQMKKKPRQHHNLFRLTTKH